MSQSRKELREAVVAKVNAISKTDLLEQFGISRISELTNLDTIGLPVYSCVRALAKTISIHSGKGLDPAYSRAGAIIEGIELEVAEHQRIVGAPGERRRSCWAPGRKARRGRRLR